MRAPPARSAHAGWQAFKACLRRECTLTERYQFLYKFRTCQVQATCLLPCLVLQPHTHAMLQTLAFTLCLHLLSFAARIWRCKHMQSTRLKGFFRCASTESPAPKWSPQSPEALIINFSEFYSSWVLNCF